MSWPLVLYFMLVWAGATLLLDAWQRRPRRPDLAERLLPFVPGGVGDQAQAWLDGRS